MRSLLVLLVALFSGVALGQSHSAAFDELAGTILIQLSPAMDSTLGAAFEKARPTGDPQFSHTDINRASLSGDSAICKLLGFPLGRERLEGLRLQPYIPTHSVAFEDIRERSNPVLFEHETFYIRGNNSNQNALRAAENKIAHWFVLSFSGSTLDDAAVSLVRKSSLIVRAEPKFVRYPCYTPNDTDVNQQYALSLMHCFSAWDVVRCDSTMILADVDVGTDWSHEDLASSIYLNQGEIGIDSNGVDKRVNGLDDDHNGYIDDWHGWDFAGTDDNTPDNDARPAQGESFGDHGTHTAGIMAATGDNRIGIAGVAFGSRIIPIKAQCDVCGSILYGFEGIIYAADMHAKIVNCSWGGPSYSDAEQDVVNYAYAKDCAVVAAAGNNGDDYAYQLYYPASYRHVLSVAMVDGNGNTVSASNYNIQVDVSAPGWNVLSTVPGGYSDMSGTSMASPDAAGVVALVRRRFPNFTAGQAMEQVRVTGNRIPAISNDLDGTLESDSLRLYFEGHGSADALMAVTDTNTHSARVDSTVIADELGTGSFAPGESGGIVLYVRNYLKPVQHLEGRLEVVSGAQYVMLAQAIVPFGADSTMQEIANDPALFQLTVSNDVPPNTRVLIRIFFSDSSVGYFDDYDYVSFIVNPSYLDLNKNNLTVTVSSFGSIGYNDVLSNQEGSGFLWRVAPELISPYGRSVLFQGGLMAGTDPDHVVDVIEGTDAQGYPDMDFTPSEIVHYVVPPDRLHAVQELACSYTDEQADPNRQIGLNTQCHAYAFQDGLAANAVVFQYIFRHDSASNFAVASDSTAAALYADWDIGLSGTDNLTRFDSSTQTALTYRLEGDGPMNGNYPLIGVRLISPIPQGAALNYRAVMNDGSEGGLNPYQGLVSSDKWTAMTEWFQEAGPGDVSHSFGLKNMPLASEDSVEMTLVIAMAADLPTLNQTIDQTAALWAQNSGVGPPRATTAASLQVFPNPFHHSLHISWGVPGPAHITIYDALGRLVEAKSVSASAFDFEPSSLPTGFYTIDVVVGGTHLRREVVAEP